MIKLVSEQNPKKIAAMHAEKELAWAIKKAAANILQIIAGGGASEYLVGQLTPVIAGYKKVTKLSKTLRLRMPPYRMGLLHWIGVPAILTTSNLQMRIWHVGSATAP